MTVYERIRLELECPSGDALYTSEESARCSLDDFYDPKGDDAVSRLKCGAWNRDFELSNESARMVRALYLNEPPTDQFRMAIVIVGTVNHRNQDVVGALVVDLGLVQGLWSMADAVKGLAAYGVADALKHCPRALRDSELADLVMWAQNTIQNAPADDEGNWAADETPPGQFQRRAGHALLQVATDVQRFRQRQEILYGANPSVDRDRRELLDRLVKLQVDEPVRDLLHDADRDAGQGDHKGALEKLRTFLERTCETCCRRAGARAGMPPLPNKQGGNIKPWKDYTVESGLLSRHEAEVIQALSSFLAREGSHAAGSRPEQFSVARASVIEWCLLLAGRCPT